VLHGATCTNIVTTPNGNEVVGVEINTPTNGTRKVRARDVVLACGGLETPRLLLASRNHRSCGIGNEHDIVGRYFMTHISGISGLIRFASTAIDREFDYKVAPDGTYVRRLILLSPEAMRRAVVGNIVFRPDIHPIADASHGDSILSAIFLAKRFIIPEYARRLVAVSARDARMSSWRSHGMNVANGLPRLAFFGFDWVRRRILPSRKLPSVFLRRPDTTYPLSFVAEQLPISDSRVLLGAQTDPYGVPRLVVQWRTCEADMDTVLRGYHVLASAARRSGLGEVSLGPQSRDAVEQIMGPAGGHHIGTVRMGSDPNSSVVDGNCEVWTTKRLFVAGCSVLPSSGYMSPTLTAVALGLRLADDILRAANARKPVPVQTVSGR
jgi:choline dehydrogenase-like flavoprotein